MEYREPLQPLSGKENAQLMGLKGYWMRVSGDGSSILSLYELLVSKLQFKWVSEWEFLTVGRKRLASTSSDIPTHHFTTIYTLFYYSIHTSVYYSIHTVLLQYTHC